MKCFVIDFVSISFKKFKVHGGGDFALRMVDHLIQNNIDFFIINNSTDFFPERNLSSDNQLNDYTELYYFNPLYQGGDNNSFKYKIKYIYIHGLRMLEMPYDSTSYKYFPFPDNVKTWLKEKFLQSHYSKNAHNILKDVDNLIGDKIILTPSEHSKYMMLSSYPVKTKIDVLPPFLNKISEAKEYILPTKNPYILMLNADRWVKNSYRFLRAFTELKKQGHLKGIDLVLIGKPHFKENFQKNIFYLDYLERPELEKLMKNCFFLAYPSLNEGFGYPPLDCFKYGVPVLSTALSSPNILYNGKVVFANPYSVDEIKSRILYLIDHRTDYINLSFYDEMLEITLQKWTSIFS